MILIFLLGNLLLIVWNKKLLRVSRMESRIVNRLRNLVEVSKKLRIKKRVFKKIVKKKKKMNLSKKEKNNNLQIILRRNCQKNQDSKNSLKGPRSPKIKKN